MENHLQNNVDTKCISRAVNMRIARSMAAEGIVLLRNDNGVLPLKAGAEFVLLGVCGYACHRMGWGSGDMHVQGMVQYDRAFEEAGFHLYKPVTELYRQFMSSRWNKYAHTNCRWGLWTSRFKEPKLRAVVREIPNGMRDMPCVVVIGRNSGESRDLKNRGGSFVLASDEVNLVKTACDHFDNVIVLLNTCCMLDISGLDNLPVKAIVLTSLLGETSGYAVADVISGNVNPSGRLTMTWARNYKDYPTTAGFGRRCVPYHEGIFVGYRYFDTFGKVPRYPFGYGLSYSTFSINASTPCVDGAKVVLTATVTNTGSSTGSHVVQCYISEPDGELEKAYQQLCSFAKTKELKPGESTDVKLVFNLTDFASYCEESASFILEAGVYFIRVGSHSRDTHIVGALRLAETVVSVKTVNRCVVSPKDAARLKPLSRSGVLPYTYDGEEEEKATVPEIAVPASAFTTFVPNPPVEPSPLARKEDGKTLTMHNVIEGTASLEDVVAQFSDSELADCVNGKVASRWWFHLGSGAGGESGTVYGEAAEFGASGKYGIPANVCADGPSGIRLSVFNKVDKSTPLARQMVAWPCGTALGQGWNTNLAEKFGRSVALEMELARIDGWLSPGLNIQRNPLCGRNFEYFSEDPLISGRMAAAVTRGVQRREDGGSSGKYITLKHFAANNQEGHRKTENNIVAERALREIYLRGFEIAVKEGNPISVMTSYNRLNGDYCATMPDLLNGILRAEWGFDGFVMTDWWNLADKKRHHQAGNDAIMPGLSLYRAAVESGLRRGAINRAAVQASAVRILKSTLNAMRQAQEHTL